MDENKYNELLDEYNKLHITATTLTTIVSFQQEMLLKSDNMIYVCTKACPGRQQYGHILNFYGKTNNELIDVAKSYILDTLINFITNAGCYYDVKFGKSKKIFMIRTYHRHDQDFYTTYTQEYKNTQLRYTSKSKSYLDIILILINHIFNNDDDDTPYYYYSSENLARYDGDDSNLAVATIASIPVYLDKTEIIKSFDTTLEFIQAGQSPEDIKQSYFTSFNQNM
jgi:hypothetical protein